MVEGQHLAGVEMLDEEILAVEAEAQRNQEFNASIAGVHTTLPLARTTTNGAKNEIS